MKEIKREVVGKNITFNDVPFSQSLFTASFSLAGGTVGAPHWLALASMIQEFFEVGHEGTPLAPAALVPCPDCAARMEHAHLMEEQEVERHASTIRATLMTGQGRR